MRTKKTVLAAALGGLVLAIGLAVQPVASAAALFSDDFEDGGADGWTKSGDSWSVVTDGSRVYQQSGMSSDARALVGGAWTDQAVQVRVKPNGFNGSGRHVAVLARARYTSEYYYLALTNTGSVVLGKRAGGTFTAGRVGVATYYAAASFDDIQVTDGGQNGTTGGAGCLVEGNHFENVEEPVSNHYAGPAGRCVARNNVFTGEEPGQPESGGGVEEPRNYYPYTLDDPNTVKAAVMAGAGVGKI